MEIAYQMIYLTGTLNLSHFLEDYDITIHQIQIISEHEAKLLNLSYPDYPSIL